MTKTAGDSLAIMRRVISVTDGFDPNATDNILLEYLDDFYQLEFPQDIHLKENFKFATFDTVANQQDYEIDTLFSETFTNFSQPVYVDDLRMVYYENPAVFYDVWPIDTTNVQPGQPTDILFFDNKFTLRTIPDGTYTIKILAYKINPNFINGSGNYDSTIEISEDYWWRYIAYGAAIDWLSDFGQPERLQSVIPMFQKYKSLIANRSAIQLMTQRPLPAL